MQPVHGKPPTRNQVRAVFEASAAVFDLPPRATFGDLAEQVSRLGERHVDLLVGVYVKTDLGQNDDIETGP